MPFTYGENPERPLAQTDGLPMWQQSGLLRLQIANCTYSYKVNDGQPETIDPLTNRQALKWESLNFQAIVQDAVGNALGLVNFSMFLSDRAKVTGLLYLLNMRNAQGALEMPDPILREGDSARTGRHYRFYTMECFNGCEVYALLKFAGMYVNPNTGKQSPQFDLRGFCDQRGFDAVAVSCGSATPCVEYQEFLNSLKNPAPQPAAPKPQPINAANQAQPAYTGAQYGTGTYGAIPKPAGLVPPAAVSIQQQAAAPKLQGEIPPQDEIPF